jgi:nucleoside-diphosphate-sugar epimerase
VKTILVTGARGTVGNYVVGLAEAAGYRVVVSDIDSRGLRAPVRGEVRAADLRNESVFPALV